MSQPQGKRTFREAVETWCRCYWIAAIGVPIAVVIATVAVIAAHYEGASPSSRAAVTQLTTADYSQHAGVPSGGSPTKIAAAAAESGAYASWDTKRTAVDIVLYGSSTCPPRPLSTRLVTNKKIAVVFAPPTTSKNCTADAAATTTRITVPTGLLPKARVQLIGSFSDVPGAHQFSVTIH